MDNNFIVWLVVINIGITLYAIIGIREILKLIKRMGDDR